MADVLACAVDPESKKIYTTIFDVKSNISAFSDNLLKNQAMLTAIKEVRDFIQQIRHEILHKNTFMIYYHDGEYVEYERIGIVTKNFECEKFLAVANFLEDLFQEKGTIAQISPLVEVKFKTMLRPYLDQVDNLKRFSEKKIKIGAKIYDLSVFPLEKTKTEEYSTTVKIMCEEDC